MELFNEIYSCYYQTVRRILEQAAERPISVKEMEQLCRTWAFQETSLSVLPRLTKGDWPLLTHLEDAPSTYKSALSFPPPELPLTDLQMSWLAALAHDPRFQLFFTDEELKRVLDGLKDCSPLYCQEDFHYYDRFRDGDSYTSPSYREHFQTVLRALREHRALLIGYENKKGICRLLEAAPYQLQYSSRDDKFRL